MNSMHIKFVNHGLKVMRQRQDANAGHGTANELRPVVKECDNPTLAWRNRLKQFDIKRRQMRGANHNDVFARSVIMTIRCGIAVLERLCNGPNGDEASGQYQRLIDWRRARDAVESGNGEKRDRSQELGETCGF